jgi:uncharacterized protein (DUF1697 family)
MATTRLLALLRGINVGGKNLVPMAELRHAFEEAGYTGVSTYIQSGNVLFESSASPKALESTLEPMLERRFDKQLRVIVRSHRQLTSVVDQAPPGFGGRAATHHLDVIFLKAPLTPRQAMRVVELRDEVDEAWTGTGVLYFARLSARRTQSRLGRIVGTPEYKQMSIRNWATTTKLLQLLDQAADGS